MIAKVKQIIIRVFAKCHQSVRKTKIVLENGNFSPRAATPFLYLLVQDIFGLKNWEYLFNFFLKIDLSHLYVITSIDALSIPANIIKIIDIIEINIWKLKKEQLYLWYGKINKKGLDF
jgi:hypothetical protein